MNIGYLNVLSEVTNEYNVDLQDGEKVVFTAKLSTFGTEKDRVLGSPGTSVFTLTNQRIIANNGAGVWTNDILEDVVSCKKAEYGKWIFKGVYFSVALNKEIVFNDGKEKMNGFHFYFSKEDTANFEEIVNNLFG